MEMLRSNVLPCVVVAFVMIGIAGCEKNRGEAIILTKEHIDAAPPNAETPKAGLAAPSEPNISPGDVQGTARPTGTQAGSASATDPQIRPMPDDEIAVEGYAMKPEVRGTSRDPRALQHEQWLVKVRMIENGRTFQVPSDRAQWEKLRENDRVTVRYRASKYTGTVWAAEIECEQIVNQRQAR
jgi:hypothetical protein